MIRFAIAIPSKLHPQGSATVPNDIAEGVSAFLANSSYLFDGDAGAVYRDADGRAAVEPGSNGIDLFLIGAPTVPIAVESADCQEENETRQPTDHDYVGGTSCTPVVIAT